MGSQIVFQVPIQGATLAALKRGASEQIQERDLEVHQR